MFKDPNMPTPPNGYQPQATSPRPELKPRSIQEIAKEIDVWDVDTGAQKVVDNEGELSQAEMNAMREELGGPMQQEFIQGGSQAEEEKQKEATEMYKQKEQYKDLRLTLAQDHLSGSISNSFMQTPQGEEIMNKLLKDDKQLVKKRCPEGEEDCEDKNSLGLMMTDQDLLSKTQLAMMDVDGKINQLTELYNQGGVDDSGAQMNELLSKQKEYKALIDSNPQKWTSLQKLNSQIVKVDSATINVLEDARNKIYKKGLETLPEDNVPFNEAHTLQTVENAIMGKGNLQSMIYDSMIPGFQKNGEQRSFYSDLKNHIMGESEGGRTYKDFGITDEMMSGADANSDGVIDEAEADVIAKAVVQDEGLVRDQLSNYFVQYLKTNYELGLGNRRDSYIKEKTGGKEKRDDLNTLGYVPQTKEERIESNKNIIEKEIKNPNSKNNEYKPQSINRDWA